MQQRRLFHAIVILVSFVATAAQATPSLLFDFNTGRVLEERDAFARWYPASLTKLMTAYVAFRALKDGEVTLLSPVRITRHAASQPPAKMGFKPGSVMTLDNALKMMLTKSANDIAMAVGENIGGSEAAFVQRMNAEAARLGMKGSHFANPNGLFSPENYTTAHDLALLVTAIRSEFPQYAGYFRIEAIGVGDKVIRNINVLIGRFDGADGMKTGFICESGFNFIGTATRQGRTLGAVVLGADTVKDRAAETAALLARGFGMPDGNGPLLASMAPEGAGIGEATNMRQEVCKKKKKHAKHAEPSETDTVGDDKEPLFMGSPYLHEMDHDPQVVMVGLGGATGPGGLPEEAAPAEYADVPVPTPRPDYPGPKANLPAARTQASAAQ